MIQNLLDCRNSKQLAAGSETSRAFFLGLAELLESKNCNRIRPNSPVKPKKEREGLGTFQLDSSLNLQKRIKGVFRSLCILHFYVFERKSSIFEVLNIDYSQN